MMTFLLATACSDPPLAYPVSDLDEFTQAFEHLGYDVRIGGGAGFEKVLGLSGDTVFISRMGVWVVEYPSEQDAESVASDLRYGRGLMQTCRGSARFPRSDELTFYASGRLLVINAQSEALLRDQLRQMLGRELKPRKPISPDLLSCVY
jgi:hypothetical protein